MRTLRMEKLAGMRKVAAVLPVGDRNFDITKSGFYESTDGSILFLDQNKSWKLALTNTGRITGNNSNEFKLLDKQTYYEVNTKEPSLDAQTKYTEARNANKKFEKERESSIKSGAVSILKNDLASFVEVYEDTKFIKKLESQGAIYFDPTKKTTLYLDGMEYNQKIIEPGTVQVDQTLKVSDVYGLNSIEKEKNSGKRRVPASGESSKAQATRGGSNAVGEEILIAPSHRGLSGLVDTGNRDYVYTTSPDGASASYIYKGVQGKTLDKNYPRWAEFVGKLNALPTEGANKTAPSATPATTTAPTEATPATTTSNAEVAPASAPVDNLTINVARLLSNVDAGHTYAGKTVFTNERGMVRRMLAAIGKIYDNYESKGITVTGDAPLALAKMIVGMKRSTLERSPLASFDSGQLSSMGEKEIEKTFRGDLDIIMRAVADIDSRLGGKAGYGKLENYLGIKGGTRKQVGGVSPTNAPVAPGATPSTPATVSNPVEKGFELPKGGTPYSFTGVSPSLKTGTSFDPRIKKLAKLRRLRVRAQMEAAVEPSAKLGRSRIS